MNSALPGSPFPIGAMPGDGGTNFAVASGADAVELCLFDGTGGETRVALAEYDAGVWHGFVPGVGPGHAYGYRMSGPFDPAQGLRYNPAKLLLDPYARAIDGQVRFGPEVLGYDADQPDRPSPLDSAAHMPRSLVVDPTFAWPAPHLRPLHLVRVTCRRPGTGTVAEPGRRPVWGLDRKPRRMPCRAGATSFASQAVSRSEHAPPSKGWTSPRCPPKQ
jgi:pullulanase/glycogen debranching enzyme